MNAIRRFEVLDRRREALMQRMAKVDGEILNRQPEPGKWSPAQVVSHLLQAETASLENIRWSLENRDRLRPSGIKSGFRTRMLAIALWSPLRFKAPAVVANVPDQLDFLRLGDEWSRVRQEWRDLIGSFPPELAGMCVMKHPVIGLINLDQTLTFLSSHFSHHTRQIDAALYRKINSN